MQDAEQPLPPAPSQARRGGAARLALRCRLPIDPILNLPLSLRGRGPGGVFRIPRPASRVPHPASRLTPPPSARRDHRLVPAGLTFGDQFGAADLAGLVAGELGDEFVGLGDL